MQTACKGHLLAKRGLGSYATEGNFLFKKKPQKKGKIIVQIETLGLFFV